MTALWEAARGLDTSWMREATCARYTALPWTQDLRSVPGRTVALMGSICAQCPVRRECANYAVEAGVTAGWWAGVNLNRFHVYDHPTADYVWGDVA